MPKILMLMDDPRLNTGYAQTNRLCIEHFQSLGYECVAVAYNHIVKEIGEYNGTKIIPNCSNSQNVNEILYGTKQDLINIYIKEKPDILLFHNDFYRQNWFLSLPDGIKKKSVWWMPLDMVRKSEVVDSFVNKIPNIVFVTQHVVDLLEIGNATVIPHAISDLYFETDISEKPNDVFTVCRVDRHSSRKQWNYSLEAFSKFAKDKDDVRFLAKCDPFDSEGKNLDTEEKIDLIEYSENVGINPNKIEFFNTFLSVYDLINNIYDKSHVFLTTTGSEGFGLSIVESMSRGCIPIAPRGSSITEVVGDERHAYLYDYSEIRLGRPMNWEYGKPDPNVVADMLERAYKEWKSSKNIFIQKSQDCVENSKKYNSKVIYGMWNSYLVERMKVKKEIKTDMSVCNNTPEYSIVIVSKDKYEMLENCLNSIIENTNDRYEVILVSNCSNSETNSKIEAFINKNSNRSKIILIKNDEEKGYSYANNLGIKASLGSYIVLMNNDTLVKHCRWLKNTKEKMGRENSDFVGGAMFYIPLSKKLEDIPLSIRNLGVVYKDESSGYYRCDFASFFFVMAKAEIFKNISLNENITNYYFEDVDYFMRMKERGIAVSVYGSEDDMPVKHLGNQSISTMDASHIDRAREQFFRSWSITDNQEQRKYLERPERVTIAFYTNNEENNVLRLLSSLMNQNFTNWDLLILNCGKEFSKTINDYLLFISNLGHEVKEITCDDYLNNKNEILNNNVKTELVFRIEDHCIVDKDALKLLYNSMSLLTCASAPIILNPIKDLSKQSVLEEIEKMPSIDDIESSLYVQNRFWINDTESKQSEYLYSCFLYRKSSVIKIENYHYMDKSLRDEVFSNYIFNDSLLRIEPSAIIWDFGREHEEDKIKYDVLAVAESNINRLSKVIEKNKLIGNIEKKKRISIIIPTYNHLDDCLKPCLESIVNTTDLNDIEVLVVANGCTDGTEKYVNELGEPFRLIWFDSPLGYAKAVNEGIKRSIGEYVVLLNNDCRILDWNQHNQWIDMLIKPFEEDDRMGITGPVRDYCPYVDDTFLIFFCVMIKRCVFEKIGLLDEAFGIGAGEDTDACMKAKKAGFKIRQVPKEKFLNRKNGIFLIEFPIDHKGEVTVNEIQNYNDTLVKNRVLLTERYGRQG